MLQSTGSLASLRAAPLHYKVGLTRLHAHANKKIDQWSVCLVASDATASSGKKQG